MNENPWILVEGSNLDQLNFARVTEENSVHTIALYHKKKILIKPREHSCNQHLADQLANSGFEVKKAEEGILDEEREISHKVVLPDVLERKPWWFNPKVPK